MMQSSRYWLAVGRRFALATTLLATGVFAPAVRSGPVSAAVPAMVSIEPARVLETRTGPDNTTIDGQFQGIGQRPANSTLALTVAGRGGIPTDADAVFLNITAVAPAGNGFLTAYPCGTPRPNASNVNYLTGDVAPNAVLAKTGTNGQICIYTLAPTHLIADVNGYVPHGGTVGTLEPARVLETRTGPDNTTIDGQFQGIGQRPANSTLALTVAGRGGIPTDADAVFLNITAVAPAGNGFLTAYPCGTPRPNASNVNYLTGDVAPNAVLAKTGTNGQICIYTLAPTHLIADVNGYVPHGGTVGTLEPARVLETRTGPDNTTIDGQFQGIGQRPANSTLALTVAGRGGIPTDADAVFLNITAVAPAGNGFLTAYPCSTPRPNASNVNYLTGDVAPNAVLAKTGTNGQICIYTLAPTHLIADVNGYVPAESTSSSCDIGGTEVPTVASQQECDALVAFYNSTNGGSWTTRTGWNTLTDPCTWHGVFCDASGVHYLSLFDNELSGVIPPEIGDLTNLDDLTLWSNDLSGPIPSEIGNLAKLTRLELGDNELTGPIPNQIGDLTELGYLGLFNNGLFGPIPTAIGNLTKLEILDLYLNELTGPIPTQIGNLTELDRLSLFGNELDGPIPTEIGNLTELEWLGLGDNELTGPIPTQIGNLTELTSLTAYGNKLDGSIPVQVGSLTDLTELSLFANRLEGPIPTQIGNLTKLTDLDLSSNQLTGSIPAEIGQLTKLTDLELNWNQLTGDLTAAFTPLHSAAILSDLALYGNGCLTTTDPTLATWLTSLDALWNTGCP